MSNRLFIRGFGPVKNAELELKSFNLLIGEQSIGKSTIAKLIAIFTDISSLSFIASSGYKAWTSRLQMYDLDIYQNDTYRIEYECKENGISLNIKVTRKRINTTLEKDGIPIKDKELIAKTILAMRPSFFKPDFFKSLEKGLLENNNEDIKYQAFALQSLVESSLYVPAERIVYSIMDNLKSAFSLLGDSTTYTYRRFMVSFDKARKRVKKYESPIFGITYLNEDDGQFFIDSSCDKKYHLYNASSGIQSSIPLLVVLNDISNRGYLSIVIEEPELNLFPNTQVEVLRFILEKTRENGRIVTITTHSPYLLSALNNSLYAGFVSSQIQKDALASLNELIPVLLRLNSADCAVYSIGESINEGKGYCVSLIDEDLGMIDSNTLDRVSYKMSTEFDDLQDLFLKYSK